MAKSILISIKPRYVADILNHKKTIEVRKVMPKCDLPIDVYIYCTKQTARYYIKNKIYNSMMNGKVVAKFTLNNVEEIKTNLAMRFFTESSNEKELLEKSCLNSDQLFWYLAPQELKVNCCGYAWRISNLVIFDKPKELSKFYSIVKEKVKTDCPFNCKGWCITKYDCKYYVEDYDWGGQLACSCPTKEVNIKKSLTKAPQSWCYVEELL